MSLCGHLIERDTCGDCLPRPVARPYRGDPVQYGPWFIATYDGECDGCDSAIWAGDRIRADGQGGWICEDCGEDGPDLAPGGSLALQGGNVTELRVIRPAAKPTVGEFMSGAGGPGFADDRDWQLCAT
jgi:hypothetical protein